MACGTKYRHVNVIMAENTKWLSILNFKFLIAICMPQCQNNGICLQPGECACPENFVGTYCEQEKKLCLSPPSLVCYYIPLHVTIDTIRAL